MDNIDDLFSVFSEESTVTRSLIGTSKNVGKQESSSQSSEPIEESVASLKRHKTTTDGDEAPQAKTSKMETVEDENVVDDKLLMSGPRIAIHTLETIEQCTHEVAVPPDADYAPLRPYSGPPAKEYPFVLDPFQKEAILCLQNSQSVLVSAHTSAGKTVVAEYAIAMSLKEKQRVIYTTPIKALSNQKYREFSEEFKDVGLMTGDVTINPTASCLIMTTEILRSMLYRGSEVVREVAWVIFDEIHYMRDKERGVVWEETIILLPDNVHFVFLSATIPNARQFAEWICHLHKQPCHVVYTDYRPVPLQHYIFPGGEGIHLVVDEKGQFREDNFNEAMAVLHNVGDAASGDKRGRRGGIKGGEAGSSCFKIIKMIMEKNFSPVVVFSFSKKECEFYALQMAKLDFNSNEEKKLVGEVFQNAMEVLSEEDRKLPQVEQVLPLLKRGIGIHHGGLLPILKETVEILFSEGLIKALFATETFAMGLNMPARTVFFTNARKFDGKENRWISSGEYIQMSGRAGRRGLDEKGIVILMIDEKMSPAVGRNLVKGQADLLNSAFHLTYNMVLNLLRVEEINPEYMLERSFFQFQQYAAIPHLVENVKQKEKDLKKFSVPQEENVSSYYTIRQQLANLNDGLHKYIVKPQYIVPFLQAGRMVHIKNKGDDFGWGIIVDYKKENLVGKSDDSTTKDLDASYVVSVLMYISKASTESKVVSALKPCGPKEDGEMRVVPCFLNLITKISSVRLYFNEDLRPLDNRMEVYKRIQEVHRRFPNGVPLLDPVKDMHIKDKDFIEMMQRSRAFEERLTAHQLHRDTKVESLCQLYHDKQGLVAQLKHAKDELKKAKSLLQMTELKCRKRVLRRLGYCTAADVIELKGRVACELSSGDELLLTEMIFNGIFNALDVTQTAALLSCFVCDEKSNEMPKLSEALSGPLKQMQDLARRIAKVSVEAKLELEEDEYVEKFKPYMMDLVAAWCRGASFGEICKMTDLFEGSIIRCMRRLEELLRQMVQASKSIGNTELENKFSEGIKLIKRDIIFAASLYL